MYGNAIKAASAASHPNTRARDVVVTGMGFCLPGNGQAVRTAADLWDVAANGQSRLACDGIYHGTVKLSSDEFAERVPEIPGTFSQHFTPAHRFGILSLAEAAADAALDYAAGDLTEAAILAGRGSLDANVDSYLAVLAADPGTVTALEAIDLYVGTELGGTPSDVALVQAGLTRSTGPCFTVSCGCASSAVQLGNAAMMIAAGAADIAVVTGVDVFNVEVVRKAQQLLGVAQRLMEPDPATGKAKQLPSFDRPMRPYDRRAGSVNFGEGSATLILESREHADRRGARSHGRILAHATGRDGLAHPLAGDPDGHGLVQVIRKCLGEQWDIRQLPYLHGASDGNAEVTATEASAVRELYGAAAGGLLMTSQEACFGHNGAPAGCLGVALTLLMMQRGEVCPTANCEQPADGLPFDPVPGTRTRALDFDHALNLTYQVGGMRSAILVGAPDAI
jgi:3-oxoacyl-[acyl-carrier-protein] synthase II